MVARLWGYAGVQALQRRVVTPRNDNKVILFVTEVTTRTASGQRFDQSVRMATNAPAGICPCSARARERKRDQRARGEVSRNNSDARALAETRPFVRGA